MAMVMKGLTLEAAFRRVAVLQVLLLRPFP